MKVFIKKLIKKPHGFSMVQVMIAAAMMAGLSLVLVNLQENTARVQKNAEIKGEINEVNALFQQVLSEKTTCEATFRGTKPGEYIPAIRISSDLTVTPFAQAKDEANGIDGRFKNTDVNILSIKLLTRKEEEDLQLRASDEPAVDLYREVGAGVGNIKVVYEKRGGKTLGGKTIVKYFRIFARFAEMTILNECLYSPLDMTPRLEDSCREIRNTTLKTEADNLGEGDGFMVIEKDDEGEAMASFNTSCGGSGNSVLALCLVGGANLPIYECSPFSTKAE